VRGVVQWMKWVWCFLVNLRAAGCRAIFVRCARGARYACARKERHMNTVVRIHYVVVQNATGPRVTGCSSNVAGA